MLFSSILLFFLTLFLLVSYVGVPLLMKNQTAILEECEVHALSELTLWPEDAAELHMDCDKAVVVVDLSKDGAIEAVAAILGHLVSTCARSDPTLGNFGKFALCR